MTIKKFLEAPEIARIKAIWRGKLIAERQQQDITYRLFKVDDFYVEARINPLSFTRHFTAYAALEEIIPLYSDAPASDICSVKVPS
ncbi:hypothetical protein [Niabella hibiscisoli]|uniref:hypothetical protein n=1 Tax=Niabella hibiscisoli TaxID=1825928 RepID=UPI001F11266A|nr:hypothetical protein [Niabella hibiscisoli]MCH5720152.1 hypothetical protein [Niabella hibiscisoli]